MAEEEYGKGVPMVIEPNMGPIEAVVEDIRYRAQLIARNQKLDSGVSAAGVSGFIAGFVFVIVMVIILPMFIWSVI
ncbi:tetrahydromethanopterin S-methyltransferase subunit F [Methanolobus zinderi]|jgi:tetrahydromethanopterin S-methyltransferase subunit F|uniref:Tetrahydromethanopterin S-methyltransferase subunit F n=1 Tax=Methanolobus zinderi TaxID=536044 RepID=A0A7D5J9V6_9EURY|nr:tetrahydromethanopterin S-methyltransferase subunit F [Methanolobus zinderi]KXS44690.1 MAG: tetrahydromethanopterin S-methyltransferase, subunit F [Methanolobus sp. T82-4]QLC50770.1 tetrahydromethanopterin S-methyltransferase subunit F [Methanolobus zinderi]